MKGTQAEAKRMKLATMCRVLGVSASGYYEWRDRAPSPRAAENEALAQRIEEIHIASDENYGMPKIWHELRDEGDANFDPRWASVGRNRIARLLREAGLQGVSRRRGFTITTQRDGHSRGAPDLVNRRFVADGPNQLWVSDATYVATWAGFIFLAIVLDVWSRKVVGWAIGENLRTELVLQALDMAASVRDADGVVGHSDKGSTYTSVQYGKRCEELGVKPSTGSTGDAYDNAMAESFFASLECELLNRRSFKSKAEARAALFTYIEGWYNPRRRHGSIGYLSPNEFERRQRQLPSERKLAELEHLTDPAGA